MNQNKKINWKLIRLIVEIIMVVVIIVLIFVGVKIENTQYQEQYQTQENTQMQVTANNNINILGMPHDTDVVWLYNHFRYSFNPSSLDCFLEFMNNDLEYWQVQQSHVVACGGGDIGIFYPMSRSEINIKTNSIYTSVTNTQNQSNWTEVKPFWKFWE